MSLLIRKTASRLAPAFCLFTLAHAAFAADVEITGDVLPNPATSPVWNVLSGTISVGASQLGEGSIAVSGTGRVGSSEAAIAAGYFSRGSATVTGSGGWQNLGEFYVGKYGVGMLGIGDVGKVLTGGMTIGYGGILPDVSPQPISRGYVEVAGQGNLEVTGTLRVGMGGSATLKIRDAATVSSSDVYVGMSSVEFPGASDGLIEVSGGTLNSAGTIYLGPSTVPSFVEGVQYSGNGSLKITGGSVTTANLRFYNPAEVLSALSASKGVIDVSGGSLNIGGDLVLGEYSMMLLSIPVGGTVSGSMTISGSGVVSNANASLVATPDKSTAMTVSGGTWTNSGSLTIGKAEGNFFGQPAPLPLGGGNTRLDITGGTVTSVGGAIVATQYSGSPAVTLVRVTGGSWLNSGELYMQQSEFAQARLEIAGGLVTSVGGKMQGGLVEVSGGNWVNSSTLQVGYGSSSSVLKITSGTVSNADAGIGYISGTSAVEVSGGTWITSGSLMVGNFGGPGTLEISGSGNVSASAGVIVSNIREIPLLPPGIYFSSTGVLNLNGGTLTTLKIANGSSGSFSGTVFNPGDASVNFNGTVIKATQTQTAFISGFEPGKLNILSGGALIDSNGFSIGIQSALGGSGALTKLGAGQLSLSGSNSYTGGTTIEAGTLQLGNVGALGAGTSGLTINGGTLDLNGLGVTVGTLSGSAGGVIRTGVTGMASLTINQSATGTYDGSIQNGVGAVSVTKTGMGTLRVTGSSSYSGGTSVESGRLEVAGLGTLGSGTTSVAGGMASDEFGAFLCFYEDANAGPATYVGTGATVNGAFGGVVSFFDNSSAGNARLIASAGANGGRGGRIAFADSASGGTAQVELYGDSVLSLLANTSGTVAIGSLAGSGVVRTGGANLTIGTNNLSTSFSGSISDIGSISKVGTGTLSLSGPSFYTGGTQIQAGTLVIANVGTGTSALGTGNVFVGTAGKLAGVGTVLGDTVLAGTLSPGNSPGMMTFAGALSLQNTAVVQMELSGLGVDNITVGGLLTYDGTLAITLVGGYRPEVGETFALFDAGSVAIGSQFDAITFNRTGYAGEMNYATGVLTITAVPEPSTLGLLAVAGVALLRRRRFRCQSRSLDLRENSRLSIADPVD